MKHAPLAALFAFAACLAAVGAPAATILYTYTGLPGPSSSCKWFDDNLTDRSIDALTRQTDLIYNRVALPVGASVAVAGTATSAAGSPLVDFQLGSRNICTSAEAIYGPTPGPSEQP